MADVNAEQFGQHVKNYFDSNESYDVLDSNPDTEGCTWSAGGCGMAAMALHQTLPGSEIHAVHDEGEIQHFAVKHQGTFYDARGAQTGPALRKRMKTEEGLKKPSIRKSSVDELIGSGIPSGWNGPKQREDSELVAAHLRKGLT